MKYTESYMNSCMDFLISIIENRTMSKMTDLSFTLWPTW
jgi:hypothetical protein